MSDQKKQVWQLIPTENVHPYILTRTSPVVFPLSSSHIAVLGGSVGIGDPNDIFMMFNTESEQVEKVALEGDERGYSTTFFSSAMSNAGVTIGGNRALALS